MGTSRSPAGEFSFRVMTPTQSACPGAQLVSPKDGLRTGVDGGAGGGDQLGSEAWSQERIVETTSVGAAADGAGGAAAGARNS